MRPRRRLTLTFHLLALAAIPALALADDPPSRPTRADSFLGIHFDFHAGADCTEIGKNTTPAMVDAILDQVHPDYLQIDCKGHPGLSSYPTKVGNPAPGFVGDSLRIWRDATAARGVGLYMHYSGVWDSEAIRRHPRWGAINPDGQVNPNDTSLFGPYAERLLIPQLRELAGVYGVDGAWVDGDCWASVPDYGPAAIAAFRAATGITDVPRNPGDPHRFEWLQFHRERFREYLRHNVAALKETNPGFQYCSNWAFSDHMPGPVTAPVDFLSGDYSPQDSVDSARVSARYLAHQGKPWDLMAWSFTTQPGTDGSNLKTAVQLEREAAVVLAQGGGFQAYFQQRRDGSVDLSRMPVMAEVAAFCRARQAVCHHAQSVPQVALLYSTANHYRHVDGLFPRDHSWFQGILNALLERQQSVDLVSEHHLAGRMGDYPLIVVPEVEYLEPAFVSELVAYAEQGGSLLIIGPKAAAFFGHAIDARLEGEPAEGSSLVVGDAALSVSGAVPVVTLGAKSEAFGTLRAADGSTRPAAVIARVGRGTVATTTFTMSRDYLRNRSPVARDFLASLAGRLFPAPIVEVTGSHDVDVCVTRTADGRLAVNLVNTAGPHRESPILREIPPVGPLEVRIRLDAAPRKVTLEPGGRAVEGEYRDGSYRCTLPKLEIHDVLVVE